MKKLLHTTLCLVVGIFIGLNLSKDVLIENFKVGDSKFSNSQIEFYDSMIKNVNTVEIYDTAELTPEIMNNRNGKIIIEKVVGEVTDYELNGKILNVGNDNENYVNKSDGSYINYERVAGAKEGDKILTYFIYNPFTNAEDDVLTRLDFIIDDNAI